MHSVQSGKRDCYSNLYVLAINEQQPARRTQNWLQIVFHGKKVSLSNWQYSKKQLEK